MSCHLFIPLSEWDHPDLLASVLFGEQPPVAMGLVQVIANPRIFGEPFVICVTKRAKHPAKEDRTGVKAGTVDLYSGGNHTSGYGALDEQDAHEGPSRKANFDTLGPPPSVQFRTEGLLFVAKQVIEFILHRGIAFASRVFEAGPVCNGYDTPFVLNQAGLL
jgi:hypothetical protein